MAGWAGGPQMSSRGCATVCVRLARGSADMGAGLAPGAHGSASFAGVSICSPGEKSGPGAPGASSSSGAAASASSLPLMMWPWLARRCAAAYRRLSPAEGPAASLLLTRADARAKGLRGASMTSRALEGGGLVTSGRLRPRPAREGREGQVHGCSLKVEWEAGQAAGQPW